MSASLSPQFSSSTDMSLGVRSTTYSYTISRVNDLGEQGIIDMQIIMWPRELSIDWCVDLYSLGAVAVLTALAECAY